MKVNLEFHVFFELYRWFRPYKFHNSQTIFSIHLFPSSGLNMVVSHLYFYLLVYLWCYYIFDGDSKRRFRTLKEHFWSSQWLVGECYQHLLGRARDLTWWECRTATYNEKSVPVWYNFQMSQWKFTGEKPIYNSQSLEPNFMLHINKEYFYSFNTKQE